MSTPMPKAEVATTTRERPWLKSSWMRAPQPGLLLAVVAGDAKFGGHLFGRLDRADVDERSLLRVRKEAVQLFALGAVAAAPKHRKGERRPVEPGDGDERIVEAERGCDVGSHLWRGGRCEPGHRRPTAGLDRRRQKSIVGTEIVSPRGDAVRFVDDHSAHLQLGQPVHEARTSKSLRREEEQAVIAGDGATEPFNLLGSLDRRVDERCSYAALGEAVDLVFHQRDERRDDHGQAAPDDSRHPVADALPGSGGRDGEHVSSGQHRFHDFGLAGPEIVEAEDLAQHAFSVGDHLSRF